MGRGSTPQDARADSQEALLSALHFGQGNARASSSSSSSSSRTYKASEIMLSEANEPSDLTPAQARLLSDPGGSGACADPFVSSFQSVDTAAQLRNAWACANADQNRLTSSTYEATIELTTDISLSSSLSSTQIPGESGLILQNGGRVTVKKAASVSNAFVKLQRAGSASQAFRVVLVDGINAAAGMRNPTMLTLQDVRIENGLLSSGQGDGAGINGRGDVHIFLKRSGVVGNVIQGSSGYGGGICLGASGSTANVGYVSSFACNRMPVRLLTLRSSRTRATGRGLPEPVSDQQQPSAFGQGSKCCGQVTFLSLSRERNNACWGPSVSRKQRGVERLYAAAGYSCLHRNHRVHRRREL